MAEITTEEIRRCLANSETSQADYNLLRDFWQWLLERRYCAGTNPLPATRRKGRTPEQLAKASETPEILGGDDVESLYRVLIEEARSTAKACAVALLLWAGLDVDKVRALTWDDVIWGDQPDMVVIRLQDDVRSGSTHRLDRPIFPAGARILRARYQTLMTAGISEDILAGQRVVCRKHGSPIPGGEMTRYAERKLKGIKISTVYYSRKNPERVLAPRQLLTATYKHMVQYECGLADMEPGTANYLCGISLVGNVTDDNYTSFSSWEGSRRLYAYMHRLCVPETLPQDLPVQVSADGTMESRTFYPRTTRDRIMVTATVLLQPGEVLTLASPHGGTGTITAEEATAAGRRRRKRKKAAE